MPRRAWLLALIAVLTLLLAQSRSVVEAFALAAALAGLMEGAWHFARAEHTRARLDALSEMLIAAAVVCGAAEMRDALSPIAADGLAIALGIAGVLVLVLARRWPRAPQTSDPALGPDAGYGS